MAGSEKVIDILDVEDMVTAVTPPIPLDLSLMLADEAVHTRIDDPLDLEQLIQLDPELEAIWFRAEDLHGYSPLEDETEALDGAVTEVHLEEVNLTNYPEDVVDPDPVKGLVKLEIDEGC
jgi:hypothetical protein